MYWFIAQHVHLLGYARHSCLGWYVQPKAGSSPHPLSLVLAWQVYFVCALLRCWEKNVHYWSHENTGMGYTLSYCQVVTLYKLFTRAYSNIKGTGSPLGACPLALWRKKCLHLLSGSALQSPSKTHRSWTVWSQFLHLYLAWQQKTSVFLKIKLCHTMVSFSGVTVIAWQKNM